MGRGAGVFLVLECLRYVMIRSDGDEFEKMFTHSKGLTRHLKEN